MKTGRKTNKVYRMTPALKRKLDKIEEDIKHNRNLSPSFKTIQEMIDYLDNS